MKIMQKVLDGYSNRITIYINDDNKWDFVYIDYLNIIEPKQCRKKFDKLREHYDI